MKEYVRTILDYPVKGIQFRDITTLLQNADHFKQVIDEMTIPWQNEKIDASPKDPTFFCLYSAPCACAQSSIRNNLFFLAKSQISSISHG